MEATKLWLAASPKRSPDEVREYMIKTSIPLLEAWSASTSPTKASSVATYSELADSGSLSTLLASDPMKQDGGVNTLVGGFGQLADEYRKKGKAMFDEEIDRDEGIGSLLGGGTLSHTPNQDILTRKGDMWWDVIGKDGKPTGAGLSVDNVGGKMVLRMHYPNGSVSGILRTAR